MLKEFYNSEAIEKCKSGLPGKLYYKIDDKFWENCEYEYAEELLDNKSYIANNIIFLHENS